MTATAPPAVIVGFALESAPFLWTDYSAAEAQRLSDWLRHARPEYGALVSAAVALVDDTNVEPILYGTRRARRLNEVVRMSLERGDIGRARRAAARTVAVMGTGLRLVYPRENAELARRIVEAGGALVSQFFPDSPPTRYRFPLRNRR